MITLVVKQIGEVATFKVASHLHSHRKIEAMIHRGARLKCRHGRAFTLYLVHRGIKVPLCDYQLECGFSEKSFRMAIINARRTAILIAKSTLPLVARRRLIDREMPANLVALLQ